VKQPSAPEALLGELFNMEEMNEDLMKSSLSKTNIPFICGGFACTAVFFYRMLTDTLPRSIILSGELKNTFLIQ
jgi:hypothetical protein